MIHKKIRIDRDCMSGEFQDHRRNLILCTCYIRSNQGEVRDEYVLHLTDEPLNIRSCLFFWADESHVMFDDDKAMKLYRPQGYQGQGHYIFPDLAKALYKAGLTETFYLTLEPVDEDK